MLSLKQACDILHVDEGNNDALIKSLIYALPDYIEVTTGMKEEQQMDEPLVDTVSGFLLTLWYYSDHSDDIKLQRTIDNLLKCITLKVKRSTGTV